MALAWLVLAVGIASVTRERNPRVALAWRPSDARAKSALAETMLTRGAVDAGRVASLVQAALERDTTVAAATRSLALVEATRREAAKSEELFRLAARVSKRDLFTRLWLIEERVAAGDTAGALYQYDLALRTSSRAPNLLFPILIKATSDQALIEPLAAMLATRPPWADDFLPRLYAEGPSLSSLTLLSERLGSRGFPLRPQLVSLLVARLADARDFDRAWQLYRSQGGHSAARADEVRNGNFSSVDTYPPIDWLLSADPELAVARQLKPGSNGDQALYFNVGTVGAGFIARQLLRLQPGRYRLTATAGGISAGSAPSWVVTCLAKSETVIFRFSVPASRDEGQSHSARLTVPADCPLQLLYLNAGPAAELGLATAWIDSVSLVRERAHVELALFGVIDVSDS